MEKKETKKTEEVKEKISKKGEEEFEKIYDDKKKFNIFKLIWNIIFWGAFAIFLIVAVVAFINYNALENDEEPKYYSSMEEYKVDSDGNKVEEGEEGTNVTVYNYYMYKVVEHYSSEGRQISLKLWFLDDVSKG